MNVPYAGRSMGRIEGMEKAAGRAKYAGDYYMPGMLYLRLIRSEVPHGKVLSIDSSRLPSGVFVFTARDIPVNSIEDIIKDQPVLAWEHIRFLGEPIAIVAADSQQAVDAAAQLIRVEYKPLPIIRDPDEALSLKAPQIHEGGNMLSAICHENGDVNAGFAEAALILEDTFVTPIQDHAPLECEASFSFIADDGTLTSYVSTQNVFHDQQMICYALALPLEKVRAKAAMVGGAFGGKDGHTTQIFSALTALRTGRPARLVFNRRESLMGTYKRHSAFMLVKIGFTREGRITAFDGSALLDTGAYAGLGPAVLGLFTEHFAGPYKVPNTRVDTKLVYTNKPPSHAMRGFGAPQCLFAVETLISRAASELGIDPLRIRMLNALEYGSTASLGQRMDHTVGLKNALALVEASPLWQERKANTDPLVGYGLAAGYLSCGLGKGIPDSAKICIEEEENGTFMVRLGLVDIGQGSRTALQAMAADALETDLEHIIMEMADTGSTFNCGSTAGSRSTFIAGCALLRAVEQYKTEKEKNPQCNRVEAEVCFPESPHSLPFPGIPHAMYTFLAQAVKLRIDAVTGKPSLLDIFAATEAGRVINPLGLDGQIQGGIAMSIGYALGENCLFKDGRLLNDDLSTYLLPTAMDVPHIENVHIDAYEQSGPMGVKGAAEVATVAIAPAIGAAIASITGIFQNRLPFDIELVFEALRKREVVTK